MSSAAPAPPSGRAMAASAGWMLVAICWIGALFLPWAGNGLLSSASLLDAVGLVGRGVVPTFVPPPVAVVMLVPAGCGIALLALSGFHGRVVWSLQMVLAMLGSAVALVLAWRIVGGDPGRVGPGAWVSTVGVLLAVASSAVGRPRKLLPAPRVAVEVTR